MKREGIGKKKKEVREKERGENRRKGELAPILWEGGQTPLGLIIIQCRGRPTLQLEYESLLLSTRTGPLAISPFCFSSAVFHTLGQKLVVIIIIRRRKKILIVSCRHLRFGPVNALNT